MDDLSLAASLAREAGTLAARMLREGLTTHRKTSISDVVSAADHAAEELVSSRLGELRPQDGIVGEEGTSRSGARTWFIDPVDGTYNFLSGLPEWCSAVALGEHGEGLLAAIYQPATDELWAGGRDAPATRNGEPLPRLVDRPLRELSLASYLHPPRLADASLREAFLRVIEPTATVRMLGSGSIELAAVAAGRLGAWLQLDCPPWDWLPGSTLVRSVSGAAEVIDAHGHRWHAAGPKQAVDEIGELLLDGR